MTPMKTSSHTQDHKEVTMAHSTTIVESPASEAGALDGFDIICSQCGNVGGYSLKTLANQMAYGHTKWHETRKVK